MPDKSDFLIPVATDQEIADFIARYGKRYDPETDTYHRDPFIADIRKGKNDPIYNAHSYHTKVPPRAIIPYILHYTEPGDIILDPFCGSGMTGVAALMCDDPPEDLLKMVPGDKRVPVGRSSTTCLRRPATSPTTIARPWTWRLCGPGSR